MCEHEWKLYQGLREEFEYCMRCDVRRGSLDADQVPIAQGAHAQTSKYRLIPRSELLPSADLPTGALNHSFDLFGSKDIA